MKTLVSLLPLLLVIFGLIILLTYFNSKRLLEEEINVSMDNQLEGVAQKVENNLMQTSRIPELLAQTLEVNPKKYALPDYEGILKNVFASNDNAFGGGIFFEPYKYDAKKKYFSAYAYKDNDIIKTSQEYNDEKFDYPSQDWYQVATDTDKSVVLTSPYLDTNVNVSMVTASAPFYDQKHQLLGVITADIDLSQIQKLIKDIKVKKTGYAFLIDDKGTYIAAPDSDKVMKTKITDDSDANLAKLGSQLLEKKSGTLEYTNSDKEDVSLFYKKVPNTNWTIGLVVPNSELFASHNSLTKVLILISVAGIALIVAVIVIYNRWIVNNVNKVKEMAVTLADGDMRYQLSIKSEDEFGQMAKSLNKMRDNFISIIQTVKGQTEQVASTSEELTAISEETSKAADQITNAIQEVAIGSETQVESTNKTTKAAEDISDRMKQALDFNNIITNLITETNDKANTGISVVDKAVSQINLVNQTTEETASRVDDLGEKSNQIHQIVELITGISEQTNLLALNASIEAARAGENGKGFAVVANEVKTLAQQSQEAAKNIATIIQDIENEITKTVQAMDNNKQMVQDGLDFVNQSGSTFKEIAKMIGEVADKSSDISNHLIQVNVSTKEMVTNIDEVKSIAEKASVKAQNVAAAAEEQNATMDEISSSAETLSKMATELQESINDMFKL